MGDIFEEEETLKDRSTGRIFELKRRTDQFVTLQSLGGLPYILTGEKSFFGSGREETNLAADRSIHVCF